MRDCRIFMIYEGTNGIQALDLVMRKLPMGSGSVIDRYLMEIEALSGQLAEAGQDVHDINEHLSTAVATVRSATEFLNSTQDVVARMAGATPYQEMLGTLAGGYYLARQALIALPTANKDTWMASKVATARFYAVNLLPKVHGLLSAVTGGSELLFEVDDEHIGAQP